MLAYVLSVNEYSKSCPATNFTRNIFLEAFYLIGHCPDAFRETIYGELVEYSESAPQRTAKLNIFQ
ncbi:hypothetical protein KL3_00020 [Klebsiella phage KL3]|nr:hypothetical protein KL3_00020 [Klebsiella phage KL3]